MATSHSRKDAHPLWATWRAMIRRCADPRHPGFRNYGARGVRVCEAWANDFWAFVRDVGDRPPGMTIERRKTSGHYEPGNCRWATRAEQSRNTRQNVWVQTPAGPMIFTDACRFHGVTRSVATQRRLGGWPEERWFEPSQRPGPRRPKTYQAHKQQ